MSEESGHGRYSTHTRCLRAAAAPIGARLADRASAWDRGSRGGLLQRGAGGDALTCPLPATQAVVPERSQPVWQDGEGLPARAAEAAAHPDAFVAVIVCGTEAPSVTDDRGVAGKRDIAAAGAPAESPRLDVVFRFWQCDKENHGWREGPPLTVACQVSICWPGLHPPGKSVSNEKRILLRAAVRGAHTKDWPVIVGLPDKWRAEPDRRGLFSANAVSTAMSAAAA